MKKFLPYILALFIPCVAVAGAGDIDMVYIAVSDTITNTASSTNDVGVSETVYGWLDAIGVDLTGHTSPNVDIDIVTTNAYGGRTLYSADDVTADFWYQIRTSTHTTAGGTIVSNYTRFPLVGDKVTAKMSDSDSATNVNLNVFLVISPTP